MPSTSQHHDVVDDQTDALAPNVEPRPSKVAAERTSSSSVLIHQKPRKVPPRRVALSGGGIRTIAHCGALLAWRDADVLNCVREYLGVSGGSFVALILSLGYTLEELKRLCLEFDFNLLNTFDPDMALSFLDSLGLDTGHALERLLISILKHKGLQAHATFKEMPNTSPTLRVYATNLTTSTIREFSKEKTPDVEIVFAVRSSMSLPLYYTPMRESSSGHTYVDGGVLHNLPMAFLQDDELHETWGIMFSQPSDIDVRDPSSSIFDYMKHLYNSMLHKRYEGLLKSMHHKILQIPIGNISPIHFSMTKQEKEDILNIAYKEATQFVYGPHLYTIQRRNSVS